jgi:hypothetical protein
MLQHLRENNYLIVDDFISPERAEILYNQFKTESELYAHAFTHDSQCPKSQAIYDWRWFVELLVEKIPFISEKLEQPMLPTYSYARVYANGEVLAKHKDRPACEVSVTLHLGSDGTEWPIYFTKPSGEVVSAQLKPGQAVIYLGCISEHWREEFTGQHYGQLFLHYVRAKSGNWDCYFDKKQKDINHDMGI